MSGTYGRGGGNKNSMMLQIVVLLAFIAMSAIACSWMFNDITGEYGSYDPHIGQIHMSIIRKATTVRSELSYGSGSILETTAPFTSQGEMLNWTYSVPERWQRPGLQERKVQFHGKIEDGVVTGVLQDGPVVLPIKLTRNAFASFYRQIQSHLPWIS